MALRTPVAARKATPVPMAALAMGWSLTVFTTRSPMPWEDDRRRDVALPRRLDCERVCDFPRWAEPEEELGRRLADEREADLPRALEPGRRELLLLPRCDRDLLD